MHPRPVRLLAPLLMPLLLAACASPRLAEPAAPAAPAAFATPPATAPALPLPADGHWWQVFAEPALDGLVAEAMAGNTSLQQAAARLAQAQAVARSAGAARSPALGLAAGASRQGGPLINAAGGQGSLFNGSLNAAWELDLAGRLSRSAEAALIDAEARQSLLRAARLAVQAEVVTNWFALRAVDEEQGVLRGIAASAQRTLQIQQARRAAGSVPEQALAQARSDAAAAEAQVLALAPRRAELRQALAFLAGQHLAAAAPLPPAAAPAALPAIPAGIPSQVLARRPDVAAAESALRAARLRLGVAQDAWLPQINLTANGGFASPELADVVKAAARSWGLGAVLALPLLDGGRREAGIAAARADLDLAAAAWREQMLVALREVEAQLSTLQALAAQAEQLQAVSDDAARSAATAASRRANGLASELDVLEAERAVLRERHALLQVQAAQRVVSVALVRALGGGWGEAPLAASAPAQNLAAAQPRPEGSR